MKQIIALLKIIGYGTLVGAMIMFIVALIQGDSLGGLAYLVIALLLAIIVKDTEEWLQAVVDLLEFFRK